MTDGRVPVKGGAKKTARQLNAEIAKALRGRPPHALHARKRKPKSPSEIKTSRMKALQERMADALGDNAWLHTDLANLEGWFYVDDDLPDREWLRTAQTQLIDASVLPEHAGAPPPNVYAWNDVFISTYRMNIDEGLSPEEAVDSARQNASDTVKLTRNEREMVKQDPKLYED